MNHSLLLGSDLLKYANIELTKAKAIVTKRIDEITDLSKTFNVREIFSIHVKKFQCKVNSQQ